jgi:hypothetical protein
LGKSEAIGLAGDQDGAFALADGGGLSGCVAYLCVAIEDPNQTVLGNGLRFATQGAISGGEACSAAFHLGQVQANISTFPSQHSTGGQSSDLFLEAFYVYDSLFHDASKGWAGLYVFVPPRQLAFYSKRGPMAILCTSRLASTG